MLARELTATNGMHLEREAKKFEKHYDACVTRLKRFAKDHPERTSLLYAVPIVLVGSALRDAKATLNYVVNRLLEAGLDASYVGENLVFIKWEAAVPKGSLTRDHVSVVPRQQVAPSRPVDQSQPPPPMLTSDRLTNVERLDDAIANRLSAYDTNEESNDEKRARFNGFYRHEDALRATIGRNVL